MKKILLIEDHEDVRENTAEILELAQYQVETAENGKVGVQKALLFQPDLIVCDIMMPVLDGYGVLHLLTQNPTTASIPFIFLTAKSEKDDFRKGMELGADDYITKPFEGIELLKAIEIRLKKAQSLQKMAPTEEGMTHLFAEMEKNIPIPLTSAEREIITLLKKQMVYVEGRRPNNLFLLLKGKVKVFKSTEDGKELITHLLGPGDFFGYQPILEDQAYSDSAQVLEEAEIMLIPRAHFTAILEHDFTLAARFIKLLARDVAEKEKQLLVMAYSSLRKKVAHALLWVASKQNKSNNVPLDYLPEATPLKLMEDQTYVFEISRENLSQLIGSATESLVRTLSDFKTEKLIEIEEGKIKILELKKLQNLLN